MYLGGAIVPMYKFGGGIVHTLCKVLNHPTTCCGVVKYLGGAKGNFCRRFYGCNYCYHLPGF